MNKWALVVMLRWYYVSDRKPCGCVIGAGSDPCPVGYAHTGWVWGAL